MASRAHSGAQAHRPRRRRCRVDFPTAARGHGRPAVGADERIRWDALMGAHHYLPFRGLVGRSVRHVAVLGEHWLALVGWHAGAFKLRARESGGCPSSSFAAFTSSNNARFLILPECAAANQPSPALGRNAWPSNSDRRNLRRSGPLHRRVLPGGELAGAGPHPRLCASPARPRPGSPTADRRRSWSTRWPATRASNCARCPKVAKRRRPATVDAHRLRSLWECLHGVPDFRSTRGRRYPLATILAIAVAAKLAGYHGATAIGEFALTQHQLRALRAFYSPRLGRFTAPSTTAFVKFSPLGPRCARPRGAHLGRAAGLAHRPRRHRREVHPRCRPAQSGRQAPARAPLWNPSDEAVQDKATRSRPCVPWSPGSTSPTLDAMHTNHHTARCLVEQCRALRDDRGQGQLPQLARRVGWARLGASSGARHRASHLQGTRSESRSCRVLDLTEHRDRAPLPHRQVASSASGASSRPARSSTRPYTA